MTWCEGECISTDDLCGDCRDSSDCRNGKICCRGECTDVCVISSVDDDALLGIGIAATVASIAVPLLCCCCCGGGALYWLIRRSKQRRGQVHQQGVHMMQTQGHVYQPGMQMMQGGQQPGMQMMQPGSYPTQQEMVQGQDQGWVNPSVPNQD